MKNNKKMIVFDELGTFDFSRYDKKIFNEFMDKNKRNIIFMPRVFGKNSFWKMLFKNKDMK